MAGCIFVTNQRTPADEPAGLVALDHQSADAAVGVEHPLRDFLLERVLLDLASLIFDAQTGLAARADDATFLLDGEALFHDILTPGTSRWNGLADM